MNSEKLFQNLRDSAKMIWKENKVALLIFTFTIILIIISLVYNVLNSNVLNSIISVIGTLVGAYFGYVLNETAIKKKEEKDERRQIKSVRSLISLEIDQNLKSLEDLWNRVNEDNIKEKDNENLNSTYIKINLSRKLIGFPLPNWKHKMWEDQTALLAISLSEEKIKKIYNIHSSLDDLKSIHNKLLNLRYEEKEQLDNKFYALRPTTSFLRAPEFWTDLKI